MKITFIVFGVCSILIGIVASFSINTETAFQQIAAQNYITHGLLFALFFVGLASLYNKSTEKK
jgi:hypothetical protein